MTAQHLDPFGMPVNPADLELDHEEMDRPMTPEEFEAYDRWVSEQEAEWLAKNGAVPF